LLDQQKEGACKRGVLDQSTPRFMVPPLFKVFGKVQKTTRIFFHRLGLTLPQAGVVF
jgi:hypothetical protein